MKDVVLISRENDDKVTHVSVFVCGSYSEAKHFCRFTNRLSITGGDKLAARRVMVNAEYPLEKYQPFRFDDFVKIGNRTIQKVLRETDARVLAIALQNVKNEVKDKFFMNLSMRAVSMLKEDMEYMEPFSESDIENAKQLIVDIYDELISENTFDEAWKKYRELKNSKEEDEKDDGRNHIVLVFRGTENASDRAVADRPIADSVSVYLFDDIEKAESFCQYLNNYNLDNGGFIYAMLAEQMVEYETAKPLLVEFDKIYEISRLYNAWNTAFIIKEAIKKFSTDTISYALFGLDKNTRMIILQNLPVKSRDEVIENIERFNKNDHWPMDFTCSREAQKKILLAIDKTYIKFRQGKFPGMPEVLKD